MHPDDNEFADSVTLKLLDVGSGNVQSIISNQSHIFQADHTGSVTNFVGGGTTLQVYEGATLLTYTSSATPPVGFYTSSFVSKNITPGAFSGDGLTTAIFANPTAMSANTAELHITISGSSQNGTPFLLPVTQSFAKSIAGADPIIAVQTNESHTFVGDSTGSVLSYANSGTTISVFEGTAQLQGIEDGDLGSITNGQFIVSRVGDNITAGADSVNGLDVVVGDSSAADEVSGSITYNIVGTSLNGTLFGRTKTQTFTVASSGTNAKTIVVTPDSYFFVKDVANNYTPTSITISGSGQNLTTNGTFASSSGTGTNVTYGLNENSVTVTSGNFVDGMVVTFTSHANDGSISDSVTLKELVAQSGNVQAILSNQSHTYPAALNGDVSSFAGGGTALQVFEGATVLTYDPFVQELDPGHYSASLDVDNITAGTFSGDETTTALLSIPTAMSETSGAIHITVTGFTQNNTAFTSSMTQSFAKSIQGIVGDTGATGDVGLTGPTFDFLTGSLSEINTTGDIAAGLLLTSDVFGFHNGIDEGDGTAATLSDFTSFLDQSGNFYLGSGSGALGAGYFAWNNADKSLLISGSAVNIQVPTFYLGGSSQYISGSNGNIEISSSNFHLQSDGDVVMQGNVTASGIRIEGNSTFQGEVTISNTGDFADVNGTLSGSQLHENFQSTLDVTKWTTPSAGDYTQTLHSVSPSGSLISGSSFINADSEVNSGGFKSNAVFLRSQASVLEFELITNDTHAGTFIGFVPDTTTDVDMAAVNTFNHLSEGVYFNSSGISIYSDTNNDGTPEEYHNGSNNFSNGITFSGNSTWTAGIDTFWKVRISLKPSGGARYEFFKNGDFTIPFLSHDSTGNIEEKVRAAVMMSANNPIVATEDFVIFTSLGVNVPIQSTRISGNSIKTGIITSNNYAAAAGSQLDLDAGTITLGGSADPGFLVDDVGVVTATNFVKKMVVVDADNSGSYFNNINLGGGTGWVTKIYFDGSQGGNTVMHMQLDVAPPFQIGGIVALADQNTGTKTEVSLHINATGVKLLDTLAPYGGGGGAT